MGLPAPADNVRLWEEMFGNGHTLSPANFLPALRRMAPSSTPSRITVHERSAREIAGGRRILLSIEDGEQVPGLLLLPADGQRAPAALVLHG